MPATPRHPIQPRRNIRFNRLANCHRRNLSPLVTEVNPRRYLRSTSVFVSGQSSGAAFFLDVIHHVRRGLEFVGLKRRLFLSSQNAVPPTPVILPGVVT